MTVCVLAAGQGKRMKSALPKVLHMVCGRPMLLHVLGATAELPCERTVVVLGHGADKIAPLLPAGCVVSLQKEARGTGDALLCAEKDLLPGSVLVIPGDIPLITGETLKKLAAEHTASGAAASVLTTFLDEPAGYGRIVRDASGAVVRIVEHRDATPEERAICEVNTGIFVLPVPLALEILRTVGTDNDQGEVYLTDVVAGLVARGDRVAGVVLDDAHEVLGVNSPLELATAERLMGDRIKQRWMREGVIIVDPQSTTIDIGVTLARGVVVRPFSTLAGSTKVASNCEIGPCSTLIDAYVENDCRLPHTYVQSAAVSAATATVPFTILTGENAGRV